MALVRTCRPAARRGAATPTQLLQRTPPRERSRGGRRGGAAVEFAVLLPFILFLCVIAADWARLMYYTICIEACARAGALYAADPAWAAQSPYATMTDAAKAEAPYIQNDPNLSVSGPTPITVNGRPGVRVTVTYTFSTFANFSWFGQFGVQQTQTLTRNVDMRLVPLTPN
jgi:Flp pilus assembly protein TadG